MKLKGALSGKNIIIRLMTWMGLVMLLTIPTIAIWSAVVGPNPTLSQLRILQVLQSFAFFILPVLIAVWLWSDQPLRWLHLDKGMSWQTAGLVVVLIIILLPGFNLLSTINQQIVLPDWLADVESWLKLREEEATLLTERFAQADTIPQLMLNLLIMALLPAIAEEMCFRGTCQGLFVFGTAGPSYTKARLRTHTHVAVWVTAVLFSTLHFQFYGFLPRLLLGALLGYMLCFSGSLYVPMLAHFTNNAFAVICFYLEGKSLLEADKVDHLGSGDTLWLGLISLAAGGALLWLFVRQQSSALRREVPQAT